MQRPQFCAILTTLFILLLTTSTEAQNRQRIQCFSTYDDDFFYLAATVQKPNLVGRNAAPFSNPIADDAIAVFLQKGDSGEKRSADSVQMAVSAAGGAQIYRGSEAAPLTGFQDFKEDATKSKVPFKYRATASEDLNKPGTPATSYTVEMAIPWLEVGGPPKPGNRLRFNVVAFSAAPGSSPIVSLSPAVKAAADVQNPSLWTEIVFVDAAVRQIEGSPNARITPRVFSQKPLIDGAISPGEWNAITSFSFGEGAGGEAAPGFTPNSASGRARPKVTLNKAPPRIPIPARTSPKPLPRKAQLIPKLVFAIYDYSVQADTRKKLPVNSPRKEDGTSVITTHPLDGEGPWMTYDRVDWHLQNADQMKQSGVDVLAPIYRVTADPAGVQARTGLLALVSALRAMQTSNRSYPALACLLDTELLFAGAKRDLKDAAAQSRLYGAIKEFYLHVPRAYRLVVPLESGPANVAILSSALPFSSIDSGFLDNCRSRFMKDFGTDLILLGPEEFKEAVDGFIRFVDGGTGSGLVKTAVVSTGVEGARGGGAKPRNGGETYRAAWKQATESAADWVFIKGWGDFRSGSEVAPTLEHGFRYADLTRLLARTFTQSGQNALSGAQQSIPEFLPASAAARLTVRLQNSESSAWTPDKHVVSYQWTRGGSPVGPQRTAPLPGAISPGQSAPVSFIAPTPSESGEFAINVNVARLDKNGVPEPNRTGSSSIFTRAVKILSESESAKSALGAEVVRCDLPLAAESGGTYPASVTLRNTGAGTWKKGSDSRITARLDRMTSGARGSTAESGEPVEIADATVELPSDVAPGEELTVRIPVTFGNADGEPIPLSTSNPDSNYVLTFEVAANGTAAVTDPQAVSIIETDLGAVIESAVMPPQLPAGKSQPVRMGIRNAGPQAWLKESASVGYHWYFLDGVEAQWDGQPTALPRDLEPGGQIDDLLANVTPPPTDGRYWLVWDVKIGDKWQSTLTGIRSNETRVYAVDVVNGSLRFVDLTKSFNLDGISADSDTVDGSLDSGHAIPAGQVPSFAVGDVAPSTLWLPIKGSGLAASRGIGFKWGPKGPKEKNIIQALGQKVPLTADAGKTEIYRTVHILAAATKEVPISSFLLEFADGTQQLSSFHISRWDAPPVHGDEVAFSVTRTVTAGGTDPKPVHFYRYTIRVGEAKKLAALILPNAPEIKIAAVTLEK